MASVFAPLVTARVSGYDFGAPVPSGGWTGTGQDFGWTKHLGSDIGTPKGSPIIAAADSTLKFQTGLTGYGNLLTETFSNGWQFLFGHVAGGASGAVKAGQQIGVTGANVGSSQGAVTLFQVKNAQGVDVNPDPILQALVGGKANAAQLFGAASASLSATAAPASTPPSPPPAPASKSPTLADILGPLGFGLQIGSQIPGPLGSIYQQLAGAPALPAGYNLDLGNALGLSAIGSGLSGIGTGIAGIPTTIGHGLADFFMVEEGIIKDWLGRQAVAFFVAIVVLAVLFVL